MAEVGSLLQGLGILVFSVPGIAVDGVGVVDVFQETFLRDPCPYQRVVEDTTSGPYEWCT
jgi:hypothetical protein